MSDYELSRDELLVYPGKNGQVGACQLRVYECDGHRPVCIAGSFDELIGTSIQNAIEMVATVVSERIGTDRFTLIEWWPHTSAPFVEVRQRRVRPRKLPSGRLLALGDGTVGFDRTRDVRVRFADPEWEAWDGEQIAKCLGADARAELDQLAGEPGEYDPERVFGVSGRLRIAAVNRYNHERVNGIMAQLAEWGVK